MFTHGRAHYFRALLVAAVAALFSAVPSVVAGAMGSDRGALRRVVAQTSDGAAAGPALAATSPSVTRIYGQTAAATAVVELEKAFPLSGSTPVCPGGASHSIVLASDNGYQDALSGQDLAQHLGTGTLLTPTTSLSKSTLTALRLEGIQKVYVVGGPLAVSTAVVNELEKTQAYGCGGMAPVEKSTGATVTLSVTRIYGQTAYGTAESVALFVGSVPTLTFADAYAGTNLTGGLGRFNDTGGSATEAPSAASPTAILATDTSWEDAESASVISYVEGMPILLTAPTKLPATTAAAVKALGVRQVILMGGPLAVANTVVKTLELMGVAVLRIAGKDYTDTAAQLATFELSAVGSGLGWRPAETSLFVAGGDGYTDGVAGAVLERARVASQTPLLLTESSTTLGPYLKAFLRAVGTAGPGVGTDHRTVSALTILGGPLAVTTALAAQMQTALGD